MEDCKTPGDCRCPNMERCPECGYTLHDKQFWMDHYICDRETLKHKSLIESLNRRYYYG